MRKKLNDIYKDASIDIKKRFPILFIICCASVLLVPVILILDIIEGNLIDSISETAIIIGMILSLYLILKGKYTPASIISVLAVTVAMTTLCYNPGYIHPLLIYRTTFYMVVPIIMVSVVAVKLYISIIISGLCTISIIAFIPLIMLPGLTEEQKGEITGFAGPSIILFLLISLLVFMIIRNNHKSVSEISEQLVENKEASKKMQKLIRKIMNHLNISSNLNNTIEKTQEETKGISSTNTEIQTNIGKLTKSFDESSQAIDAIDEALSSLNLEINEQISAVNQTSVSIEEMSASIANIAKLSHERIEDAKSLTQTAMDGAENMDTTISSFSEIVSTMDKILELTTIIDNVASQTNILAMNAAIEAAHAGEAGKGFSVVADEIRKMAEGTAESAKNIGQVINTIIEAIHNTEKEIGGTADVFQKINKGIDVLNMAFETIASSMQELAAGSEEILKATNSLTTISVDVKDRSDVIMVSQEIVDKQVETNIVLATEMINRLDHIGNGIIQINHSMEQLKELSTDLSKASDSTKRTISTLNLTEND